MPAILERLVSQLQAKGMPKSNAFAIATSQLQKAGDLKKGTQEATPKGAKDRAARASGTDKKYDVSTNRAKLK